MPELDALIIGGDSQIGQRLREAIAITGRLVVSTTRKWPPGPGMLPFDLRYDSWLPDAEVTYFCTGINGFKPCEADPAEARRINVDLLLETARRIKKARMSEKLVFLSSSAAETHPETVYGRCKIEAEIGFVKLSGTCYRFGPVAFPGRDVYPNETYSPINLPTLTRILVSCFTTWEPGIHSVYNRSWVREETEERIA